MVQSENYLPVNNSYLQNCHFLVTLVIVSACWLFITFLSRQPDQWTLYLFLAAALLMVIATVFVLWQYHRSNRKIPFVWIIVTALLLRLISLYGEPLFEDDYFRYMWDGYQTVTTMDPYTLAPSAFFDREDFPESFDPILSLINYPDIATVYGPVTQWIFALGYLIDAAEVWPLQLLAGLADIILMLVLYRLGAGNALLLYAWSPLVLKEFSLTAHPDIYALLAMFLGVLAAAKKQVWLAGVCLALAVGSKVFAILVLPYLLARRWSVRYWAILCGWFVITIGLITAFFGSVKIWFPDGLQAMAGSWLFNSAVYLLLLEVLPAQAIKIFLLICFSIVTGIICFTRLMDARKRSLAPVDHNALSKPAALWSNTEDGFRGDWLFMLFLLALPVVNPWYVIWVLPFATLTPRWWSWTFAYACLLSYWLGANVGETGADSLLPSNFTVLFEYASVVLVTVVAWIALRRHQRYQEYVSL